MGKLIWWECAAKKRFHAFACLWTEVCVCVCAYKMRMDDAHWAYQAIEWDGGFCSVDFGIVTRAYTNTQQVSHTHERTHQRTHTNTVSNRSYNKYSHVCELQFGWDFFLELSWKWIPRSFVLRNSRPSQKEINCDVCRHTRYKVKHMHTKCHQKPESTQFGFQCFLCCSANFARTNFSSEKLNAENLIDH